MLGRLGFSMLSYMFFTLAAALMCEAIISLSPTIASSYVSILGMAFFNFTFSGLFIKAQSLPSWLSPWIPSVSMIRWNFQANFINTFKDSSYFGTLPSGYSIYVAFLNLFGWGGKTKWYCLYMVLANVAVFKFLCLLASGYSTLLNKGKQKKVDIQD